MTNKKAPASVQLHSEAMWTARSRAAWTVAVVAEDGVTGHEVVASPDGKRAFVPIYGNAGVGRPGTDGRLLESLMI